jgi:hypothetical protein
MLLFLHNPDAMFTLSGLAIVAFLVLWGLWLLFPHRHYALAVVRPAVTAPAEHSGADGEWATDLREINDDAHHNHYDDDPLDPTATAWVRPDRLVAPLIFEQLAEQRGTQFVTLDPLSHDWAVWRDQLEPPRIAFDLMYGQMVARPEFYGWTRFPTGTMPVLQVATGN